MNVERVTARPERSSGNGETLLSGLRAVYRHMSRQRRRQFLYVLLLMLAGAVAELATIGAVIPFIALLANSRDPAPHWLRLVPAGYGGASAPVVAGAAFILFAVVAGIIRFQLGLSSRGFVFELCHDLCLTLQRRILSQPYAFHVERNMSTLVTVVDKVDGLVTNMILPLMQGLAGAIVGVCVLALLIELDPLLTLTLIATLLLTYGLFTLLFRQRLNNNGAILKTAYDDRMKVLQESLGGIRELIIDGSLGLYLALFRRVDWRLAKTRTSTQLMILAPYYLIETLAMVLIAVLALWVASRSGGITAALPVLGTLALAAQRLLPLIQNIYRAWSGVEEYRPVLGQVEDLLLLPVAVEDDRPVSPLPLRKSLRVEDVSFGYSNRRTPALSGVGLTVPAGTMLAVTGETGSGKTTFADLIMGLMHPDSGRVLVDDVELSPATIKRWHKSIGHVPQQIFLADSSIAHNIALSLPDEEVDEERVVAAARKAELHDFILSLPEAYDTVVGERGVRLSGGQRQRLGIARAIYKGAPILILDEATSALDERTEDLVLGALKRLRADGRTIIMIAHRRSTISACDLVIRLEKGRLVDCGPGTPLPQS